MPDLSISELTRKIESRRRENLNADKLFVGMFINSVANEIFKQSKVNTNKKSSELSKEEILKIANSIKNLQFEVVGSYDNNQVYSGGVSLKELTPNLMSKNVPNLYFAGEICDVDGECGGYNLQWAWTSGKIVGECL